MISKSLQKVQNSVDKLLQGICYLNLTSKLNFSFFIFLFSLITANGQGAIDGFMKSQKETDFALTYSIETYDQYWFGSELEDRELETRTASLFLAHGLGKRFNLIVALPYMWTETESSFQDATVAFKFYNEKKEFSSGRLSKITGIGFSFPVGGYEVDVENPIGERAVNFVLRHLWQYNANNGWFAQLQSGIEFRVIPIAKLGIPALVRVGWGGRKIYVDAWLDLFHTFSSGVNQTINAGEGSAFTKIGGTIYYSITPHFGVFLGGAQFLSGKNIGKASRVNVGIVAKRF